MTQTIQISVQVPKNNKELNETIEILKVQLSDHVNKQTPFDPFSLAQIKSSHPIIEFYGCNNTELVNKICKEIINSFGDKNEGAIISGDRDSIILSQDFPVVKRVDNEIEKIAKWFHQSQILFGTERNQWLVIDAELNYKTKAITSWLDTLKKPFGVFSRSFSFKSIINNKDFLFFECSKGLNYIVGAIRQQISEEFINLENFNKLKPQLVELESKTGFLIYDFNQKKFFTLIQ